MLTAQLRAQQVVIQYMLFVNHLANRLLPALLMRRQPLIKRTLVLCKKLIKFRYLLSKLIMLLVQVFQLSLQFLLYFLPFGFSFMPQFIDFTAILLLFNFCFPLLFMQLIYIIFTLFQLVGVQMRILIYRSFALCSRQISVSDLYFLINSLAFNIKMRINLFVSLLFLLCYTRHFPVVHLL